jgi:virginiamycin B lyase
MNLRFVAAVLVSASLVLGCASAGAPAASPAASGVASAAPSPSASASAAPSPSPSSSLPGPVDIAAAGALTIEATPAIDWVVVVDGHAWIAGPGEGIGIFDKSGKMVASAAVIGQCESMDVGFGAVWSATCARPGIYRIDTKTRKVDLADLGEPIMDSERSVGAGEGAVWIVAGASSDVLLGIDPKTLKVAHRYEVPAGSAAVRAGLGGIWVTRPDNDELLHVDPSSGKVVATIAVGDGPRFLAVGEGGVWVMNQTDGTVSRVDPRTDTVTATIATSMQIYGGDMAVGGGSVWVRGGPELLFRIDPATNLVTDWYRPDAGSGGAAADDDAVWVTAHDVSTIWRLPLH